MHRILETWKLLDMNDSGIAHFTLVTPLTQRLSGGVDCEELIGALMPMGADPDEVQKMVRVADTDGDGEVSFKEFLRAYHTNEWFKVLAFSD